MRGRVCCTCAALLGFAASLCWYGGAQDPVDPPANGDAPKARLPIPAADKLKEAAQTLREIYAAELKQTGKDNQIALAKRMHAQAAEIKDDAAAVYQLLVTAADLAARSGDWPLTQQILASLEKQFLVVGPALALEHLNVCLRSSLTKEQYLKLSQAALASAEQAAKQEQFDTARQICERALFAARAAQDTAAASEVTAFQDALSIRRAAWDKQREAQARLKANPDDPDANLAVGKFSALNLQDWAQALPFLAKAGPSPWAAAAKSDMALPVEAPGQLAVGELWFDLAKGLQKNEQAAVYTRARFWYEMAQPGLTGLQQVKAEKRVAEIKSLLEPPATTTTQPVAKTGATHSNVLPTQDELRVLYEFSVKKDETGFLNKANALKQRLASNPETWSEADFKNRLEAEKRVVAMGKGVVGGGDLRGFEDLAVLRGSRRFAGASENAELLAQRIKIICVASGSPFGAAQDLAYYAIMDFMRRNEKQYATPELKNGLCDLLKARGVNSVTVDRVRDFVNRKPKH